jgi:LPS-assembly lipoprotein
LFERRAVAAALLTSLLVACGFQLQGRVTLAPALGATFVEAENPQSEFVQQLRNALRSSGVTLVDTMTGARTIVTLERDAFSERVLSVSGRNLPREYELIYAVRFAVRERESAGSAPSRERIAPEDLTVSREMSFDERAALAKEREKEVQREALARDLVGLVMRRLASL